MSNINYRTTTTESQSPVWIVATEWMVEPELTEAKRSSDGRWLKQDVELNTPVIAFSASKMELAGRSDYDDAEQLFAARR